MTAPATPLAPRCCGNCVHWCPVESRYGDYAECTFPMPSSVTEQDDTGACDGDDCPQFVMKEEPQL
jgi:hypothetical protein